MSTILIADDSLFQRLILSKIAKSQKHDVFEAKNGLEALDMLRSQKPDMALLDLNMPEFSGLEVLDVARHEGLETDIVVITADIQETTRTRCFELGARAILSKPPKETEVLNAMNQFLQIK